MGFNSGFKGLNLDGPALAVAQDGHLQSVTIPETAYVQSASLTS